VKSFGLSREKLSSPLARRLIIAIIVVSSTITLWLTALQLYGDYRSELGGIQAVFRQIEEVHLRSLSQSLWATNEAELQLQIEGIARVPNLEYIVVREGDRIWAQAGYRASRKIIERQYQMTYVHRGQTREIGTLTVVASLDVVYRGLVNRAFIILASNAVKTFLVAGFAFAFFHWLVNRHLLSIAKHLRGLDLRGRASSLTLGRAAGRQPDELDEVAAAINLMQENARALLAELRHETELARMERSGTTEAQARLAAIVEHSSDAIVGRALDYTITSWNAAAERMLGYTAAEVIGRDPIEMFPLELQPKIAERRKLLSAGQMVPDYETVLIAKDGRHINVAISYAAIKDHSGGIIGTAAILRDITERKRAEDALHSYAARLRELSRRLREVEESERRAISRELHDRIGQGLTTLGLMVGALDARLPREARSAVQTLLKDMQALIQYAVAHVRDVMAELRPPVLDDYGLLAALRHHVTEFSRRTGVAVNVSGVEPYPRLLPVVETAMFRIIQEALNNTAKHAHAKNVEISLNPASGRVVLDIADDGVGFDSSDPLYGGEHWGMTIMRERAEAVGVTLRRESAPGAGTRVVLEAEWAAS